MRVLGAYFRLSAKYHRDINRRSAKYWRTFAKVSGPTFEAGPFLIEILYLGVSFLLHYCTLIFFYLGAPKIQPWITAMIQPEVFNSLKLEPSGFSTVMKPFLFIVSYLLVIQIPLIPGELAEIMKYTRS